MQKFYWGHPILTYLPDWNWNFVVFQATLTFKRMLTQNQKISMNGAHKKHQQQLQEKTNFSVKSGHFYSSTHRSSHGLWCIGTKPYIGLWWMVRFGSLRYSTKSQTSIQHAAETKRLIPYIKLRVCENLVKP